MVTEINDNTFGTEVYDSDKPVLVDFWAEWCAPCKVAGRIIDELSEEISEVKFVKIDVDTNPVAASSFRISSIPTFILFKGNEEIATLHGLRTKEQFKNWIKEQA